MVWEIRDTLRNADKFREVMELAFAELDEETKFNCITVLKEAISNAFKHGNQGNLDLSVYLRIAVSRKGVEMTIEDSGRGFDWWKQLEKPINLEAENGRGIMMMKAYCQEVVFALGGRRVYLYIKKCQKCKDCKCKED